MGDELKRCPFCGGEAELQSWYIKGIANKKHYRMRCKNCGCNCLNREYASTGKAMKAWNRRASDDE